MTNRKFLSCSVLSLLVVLALPQLSGRQSLQAQEKRFHFKIDPKTPVKDLLPVPPKESSPGGPLFVNDLAKVPEVQFQEPLRIQTPIPDLSKQTKALTKEEVALFDKFAEEKENLLRKTAHQIAKIDFLNRNHPDRFMIYLLKDRPDLAGLPFVMGDACRMDKESGRLFMNAVQTMRGHTLIPIHNTKENQAAVAAMMQMLATERSASQPWKVQAYLVDHLAEFPGTVAFPALAKLAIFAEDTEVRSRARKALETRKNEEIKAILLRGLNYPLPAVAENACEAIVQLKCKDLVPDLINILEQPDPRLPAIKEIKGKKLPVVRELVRINHHRNCLLCHPPGNTEDVLIGEVPTPGESLSPPNYNGGLQHPDIVIRADVTYLRQDFSRLQKVPNAYPWPEMQRFDFLVRTRILTEAEAKKYEAEFAKVEKNSPYRQAALTALRALTGLVAEPTAEAWRKVLAQKKP